MAKLLITVQQVQEAIADYVNKQGFLGDKFNIKAEHVTIKSSVYREYEDATFVFEGAIIDVAASQKTPK